MSVNHKLDSLEELAKEIKQDLKDHREQSAREHLAATEKLAVLNIKMDNVVETQNDHKKEIGALKNWRNIGAAVSTLLAGAATFFGLKG